MLSGIVLSLGTIPVVAVLPATPAHAVPTSNLAVVSQQGCTTKDEILLANPNDGSLGTGTQPGKPVSNWGPLNDAKPIQFNTRIVGLWGGSSDGRLAGVGVYDRGTQSWPIQFPLPTTLAKGGPHSVARLPGDYFAVAHHGTITGTQVNGAVLLFNKDGGLRDTEGLASAHGVEWDEKRKQVFAIGYDGVKVYDLIGEDLRPGPSWKLPGTIRNGHDLRRRRTDTKFTVSGNEEEWLFNPEVEGTAAFTPLLRSDNSAYDKYVKSLDEGYDGVTLATFHMHSQFYFSNRAPEPADFCLEPYKYRWIYPSGTPVYNEETDPPEEPAETGPAEPFLWARKMVTTTDMPPVKDLWLGGATKTTADAAKRIVEQAITDGNIPFVKFYHWGDDGTPSMKDFRLASTTNVSDWEKYAHQLALGFGDNSGYVVMEPEYDNNMDGVTGACSPKFQDAMKRIVTDFKNTARNVILINQSSFWSNSSAGYGCYAGTAKTMHAQGFLLHISNTSDNCTERVNGHWEGPYYRYGDTQQSTLNIVSRVEDRARWTREAFGTSTAFLSDWAVTSCDWGGAHQADLVDRVADAVPNLYKNHGLRGAIIRTGPPDSDGEKYLGIENENGFVWSTQTATRINAAYAEVQTMLQGMSGGPATPTFDTTATAPPSVGPSQQVPINASANNTGGSLANGHIKIEVRNSANGIVDSTSFDASWSTGQSQSRTWNWTGTATAGTYSVHVGVFSSDWQTVHDWAPNAASFTVTSTAPPAFTSSATASPATVAPSGSTTITATVTNNGSTLTNGEITIEVYAPDGQLVHRDTETGKTISGGAQGSADTVWTAPPEGAGQYRIGVIVTGAGGTPGYGTNASAGVVEVGPARFTSTGTVSKPVVLPGASTVFTANVTNGGSMVTGAEVRLSAKDSAGNVVGLQTLTGQTLLGAGATSTFTWNWTTPTTKDVYALRIGVYTTGGASVLHWNPGASSVTVADAKLTASVDSSPSTVSPSGAVTFTVTVTNVGAHIDNGIVAIEIYNSAGTKIDQEPTGGETGQTIAHGEVKTYSFPWTAPATTGTYTVKAGVWKSGWTPTYHYSSTAADTVTVANPAFTSSAVVSSNTPSVGGTVTITGTVTNIGGALVNGIASVRVYNSTGGIARDCQNSAQNIANGATATYTCTWVPLTAGTYTVKIGVWNSNWSVTHHWNNGAATIQVGATTFQPSFDVGNGANTWWIEVYTSSDVTAVDVVGKNGQFYKALTKQSWGAWTATATSEMPAGSLVQFIARRSSDGATAGSNNFPWLQAEPTTEAGWVCSVTKGSGASTTWVEALACSGATSVEVKAGSGSFTALTYSTGSGKWGKAMNVATGTKVIFRATNASGAKAYSAVITW